MTSGSPAGSGRTVLTLHENFRAVFYAPFYAAFALDAFAAEGLEVRLETSDVPGPTARGRENGNGSDAPAIWWGGPMRILVARDADPNSDLVSFCEVATRDPFFVMRRTPCSEFDFAELGGCRLGTVSEVPTPWICLQDNIRRAGIEPTGLNLVTGRSMAENAQALRDGTLDAAQLFEPFVEELVASGVGHIWYAAASRRPTALYEPLGRPRDAGARPGSCDRGDAGNLPNPETAASFERSGDRGARRGIFPERGAGDAGTRNFPLQGARDLGT